MTTKRNKPAAGRPPRTKAFRVSEKEERLLKNDVQSIFFTVLAMDRFLGKKDPATGMAVCAAGLGQSLLASSLEAELGYEKAKAALHPRKDPPAVDCAAARKREAELVEAFFFHLREMGMKASLAAVKPVAAKGGICSAMTVRNLLIMAIPALISAAGGVLAALWRPSHQARSLIQHFAAGVVLAALAVELFPDIEKEHSQKWMLVVAFAAGSLFMFGIKVYTERMEKKAKAAGKEGGVPKGLLVATFVDVATDGFIIGAGFAAGGSTGMVLALGLSVELLFLGMALTPDSAQAPGSRWKIILLSSALGLVVLGAAVLGSLLLKGASPDTIGAALAASAAALLYLVTDELLMEAHTIEERPYSVLVLFGGFLAFWCVQLFGG